MRRLDLTLPTIAENLALDEALLLDAEAGGPEVLRFWEWTGRAVVLGAGGKWAEETHAAACQRDGVPIVRRASGGGAVVLGPGCLLFSLVLAYERDPMLADLHASYRRILTTLASALTPHGADIAPAGISDLAIAGKKCSGNSQQRKRAHLLHHGTLLCDFDVALISRYLAHPLREPGYRQKRAHPEFVTNLHLPTATVKASLCRAWQAHTTNDNWPRDRVRSLCVEKYNCSDWHLRR